MFKKATQVVHLLVEGIIVRVVSRFTGVDKKTILALLLTVGKRCRHIFDARVRGVMPRFVELDELWCFVHTKEKSLRKSDPEEWGDVYTWIALDAETKLVISYLVAKRDGPSALDLMSNLSTRVSGRLQITSDGFMPYIGAVEECFGADVDFAQLVNVYGKPDNSGPDWYGPPKVIEAVPTPVSCKPDLAHVCTSFVERSNLSVRMHLRRFTRLTNAFSKKLSHLKAAVDLYVLWYNVCRVHQTLRVTPAMSGVNRSPPGRGGNSHMPDIETFKPQDRVIDDETLARMMTIINLARRSESRVLPKSVETEYLSSKILIGEYRNS